MNNLSKRERLAIWLKCYRHFSPTALLLRLQEIREEYNRDDKETADIKILAIKSILQMRGHACN